MNVAVLDRPRFSIIVPTFGRPEFLGEALASVLQQSVTDFECVVVDDHSPDPVTVVDDPRIQLVRRPVNGGPAAARNTGARHARGSVLLFLDDDDLFTPDRLAIADEGLQRAPLALCWSRYADEPEQPKRVLDGDVGDVILDQITPHLGTVAIRAERFVPFDETYDATEDVDWWLRTAQNVPVATVSRFGCLIRRHAEVRVRHGAAARVRGGQRLLDQHRDYFAAHPRAAAFRWRRIGLTAAADGDLATARAALARSFRLRPDPRVARNLAQVGARSVRAGSLHSAPSANRGVDDLQRRSTMAAATSSTDVRPGPMDTDKPPFVVTGVPRSGTLFTAHALAKLGFPCGHEVLFGPHTTSVPDFGAAQGDVSWLAAPFLGELAAGSLVLHQVREPLAVIRSLIGMRFLATPPHPLSGTRYRLQRHHIRVARPISNPTFTEFAVHHLPHLFQFDDEPSRAAYFWVLWNRMITAAADLPKIEYHRYRIEDLDDDALRDITAQLGRPQDLDHIAAVRAELGTDTHHTRTIDAVTLDDIADAETREALVREAATYGYDL